MKATIEQHSGDLDAAESACADLEIGLDELAPTPSSTPSTSRKRPQDPDSALLESLQKRVAESGSILKDLSKAQQQPITARTAFANYVKDSLLTMSKAKYKKARSTINRLLSDLMEDNSDDDMGAPPHAVNPASQPLSSTSPTAHQFNTVLRLVRLLCNLRAVSATSPHVEKRASTIISVGLAVTRVHGAVSSATLASSTSADASSFSTSDDASAHHHPHPSVCRLGLCCPGTEGAAHSNPGQSRHGL